MQPQVPPEIQGMLRSGECIIWYGRPVKAALTRKFLPFMAIGLLMVLGSVAMFIPMMAFGSMFSDMPGNSGGGASSFFATFIGFFIAFIVIGIVIALAPFVVANMLAKNLHYTITDQRLITLGGIFGPGMQSTDYDKVQSVDVVVGFFDRSFGTGTIIAALPGAVYSGHGHYRQAGHSLMAVGSPYMVQKTMMEAMDNYNRAKSGAPPAPSKTKSSKFCRYCAAKLPGDSKFCSACGKEQ
jgi:hypothetical protein